MLAKRSARLESTARNRVIRVHLGERLGAYYHDCMQDMPPPARLAELIEELAKRLEEQNSKSEPVES